MSECYLGEIRMWAGVRIPENWMLCNGQSLSISTYQTLYALIGTTYGGDSTSFKLPNLQGLLPIGQGQGPGLTNRVIGQTVGAETETLSVAEMPAHSHPLQGNTASATTQTPTSSAVFAATPVNFYSTSTTAANLLALQDIAVSPNGASPAQPHANRMATTAINYIIATLGLYPQQP